MVGEGNSVDFDVSQTIIHNQITVYGSWVTSLGHMEELVEKLVEWNLKPEVIVSHRFTLDQAADAYRIADEGQSGKVVIVLMNKTAGGGRGAFPRPPSSAIHHVNPGTHVRPRSYRTAHP